MHADDECDPLDRWLSQQAQPLPPPPGTFELITRRARRRKLRKLAVTMVSAAAVAAAVAVAVPIGLNLHLSTPPTKGSNVADGGVPTHLTESPNGSGSPVKTASPSPSSTHSATAPPSQAHPVPANFQPTSVTFVSPRTAWVIGQAGTPGDCANTNAYICTSVAKTDDGGQTWQGRPAPDTSGPNDGTGVSGIRFLNDTYGWAFGPELWATDDGGATWTQVNTPGARVTDLEASDGRAYALWATGCAPRSGASFADGCTSYTLMTATAGSNDWTPVGAATSDLRYGGAPTSAVIELAANGYLVAPDGALYSGAIGGTWSQVGTSPCEAGPAQADGLPSAAQLALVPGYLWIACPGTKGTVTSPPTIYRSDNGGSSWTQPSAASLSDITGLSDFGSITSLTATPDTLTLATTTGIYHLPSDGGGWQPSNATGSAAPKGGFSYVGMTTDEQGVAVPADTSLHEIWMTTDGGATWAPATSITPGH
jgi:photosystem II stability/assembly factor-like uncharacterized protein